MGRRTPMSPKMLATTFTALHLSAKLAVIVAAISKVEAAIGEQQTRRQLAWFDLGDRIGGALEFLEDYGEVEWTQTVTDWESIPPSKTEAAAIRELASLQARQERFVEAIELRNSADSAEAEEAEAEEAEAEEAA